MGLLKKLEHGWNKHVAGNIDKAFEKIGGNIGEFINDLTGVTASARQQYQYNQQLQTDAQNFNAQQAQIERDWQAEMSNTARQRGVSDLQQAGLNPILSAGEGAWAGAGAAATSPGATTGTGIGNNPISMITELINASNNTARTNAEVKKTNAETRNINKNTENGGEGGTSFTRATSWIWDKAKKIFNIWNESYKKAQDNYKKNGMKQFAKAFQH